MKARVDPQCVSQLKRGDEEAAELVWNEFFERLCIFARKKLAGLPRRMQDEEDVALGAINALCDGAKNGRFRRLESMNDVWCLLTLIATRRSIDIRRKQKKSIEVGESAIRGELEAVKDSIHLVLTGDGPDALFASISHTCEELMSRLDLKLRRVAVWKLQGYTNEEIAVRQQRSVKTVERYLKMIRHEWSAP